MKSSEMKPGSYYIVTNSSSNFFFKEGDILIYNFDESIGFKHRCGLYYKKEWDNTENNNFEVELYNEINNDYKLNKSIESSISTRDILDIIESNIISSNNLQLHTDILIKIRDLLLELEDLRNLILNSTKNFNI